MSPPIDLGKANGAFDTARSADLGSLRRSFVQAFLPCLAERQRAFDQPFLRSTAASLNLSDDAELLVMMKRANFVAVIDAQVATMDRVQSPEARQPLVGRV